MIIFFPCLISQIHSECISSLCQKILRSITYYTVKFVWYLAYSILVKERTKFVQNDTFGYILLKIVLVIYDTLNKIKQYPFVSSQSDLSSNQ